MQGAHSRTYAARACHTHSDTRGPRDGPNRPPRVVRLAATVSGEQRPVDSRRGRAEGGEGSYLSRGDVITRSVNRRELAARRGGVRLTVSKTFGAASTRAHTARAHGALFRERHGRARRCRVL